MLEDKIAIQIAISLQTSILTFLTEI